VKIFLAYFGPQTKKLLTLINVQPDGLFSGDYISALRGCCAMKFLHALEIDQGNLAHTPTWTGVPPPEKNLIVKIKNQAFSGLVGLSSRDFFQPTCREAGVIKWAQFLKCPPPRICDGKRASKIFRDFWQLPTLIANISGKAQHIKNRKSSSSSTTPPTLGEKKLAYFGPQTKKLLTLIYLLPNRLFSRDYISALRGCCALEFLPCDAMRCTVLVIVILFVCLSDRPSITLVDCVHMVRPTIMISSPMVAPSF